MIPLVAIVGRPNTGKSTLFNRLTRTRQALVEDIPGVTRDRLYGRAELQGRQVALVDTGGFDPPADQAFAPEVHAQIELALMEADLVLFLADGRAGLNPADLEVARRLRKLPKPVIWAVNKVDGYEQENAAQEFQALGVERLHFISAAHGYGLGDMVEDLLAQLPPAPDEDAETEGEVAVRVALIGRPNVGKSSMLNALVGAERVVVSAVPGTTRDAVDTPLNRDGKDYLLIDTAGIRRQGRVERGLEKAGVFRSLRALERSHVAVIVADASQGLTDHDLNLMGQAIQADRGLVVVFNKWDLLAGEADAQARVKEQAMRVATYAPWAPILYLSALNKKGLHKLLPTVDRVWADFNRRLGTGPLNQALEGILARHAPPSVKGRRIKVYYAAQVAVRPPTVALVVNDPAGVHFSYRRYLNHELRKVMELDQAPLRLLFRPRSGRKPKRGGKGGNP